MTSQKLTPSPKIRWAWLAAVGLVILLIAAILLRRTQRENTYDLGKAYPFAMLEITAEDSASLLTYPMNYFIEAWPGDTAALPVGDGEQMAILFPGLGEENFHTVAYDIREGHHWRIGGDSSFLYLNGELASVILDDDPRTARWLEDSHETSWPNLQAISLYSDLSEAALRALSDLLDNNPATRLCLNMDYFDTIPPVLVDRFRDRLFVSQLEGPAKELDRSPEELDFPAYFQTGSVVLTGADTLLSDHFYDNLPTLFAANRQIVLSDFSLVEMQRILAVLDPEKLIIVETDTLEQLDFLSGEPNLRALEISTVVLNLEGIAGLPQLEWLTIRPAPGARGLDQLRNLRYLAIDANPADFVPILHHNPELRFLDISRDTLLRELTALTDLPRLTGLALPSVDSLDLSALAALPDLRYVSLPHPNDEGEERAARARVLNHCPDCLVYFSENYFFGICLGSGWLLLLIPLALAIGLGAGVVHRRHPRSTYVRPLTRSGASWRDGE